MKKDANCVVIYFKAKMCLQAEGVDFGETFAPVAKFNIIRVFLAIGVAMDLEMHQIDVRMVSLNDELDVVIYIQQLEGFVQKGREHLVCKLKKSLYGLKQFGRV